MKKQPTFNTIHLNSVDSTNLEAKRRIQNGLNAPTLIIANEQTNGRGRLGRRFYSPISTGAYFSYTFFPKNNPNDINITARAAVAVAKTIEKICNLKAQIKWVNDIYIRDKKVCGILTEAITDTSKGEIIAVIVGIGINISTEVFPDDIKDIAGSLNSSITPTVIAEKVTETLERSIENSEDFIDYYRSHSCVLGKDVTFISNGIATNAKAINIDQNAGLIVKLNSGEIKTLSTGEISLKL